jgi:hypothetical protein
MLGITATSSKSGKFNCTVPSGGGVEGEIAVVALNLKEGDVPRSRV